ncbi:MAG: high frequency lysogenization protein HflD [Mariprofundaceae bacterium]
MSNDLKQRAIALAGIIQAAYLVQSIARRGTVSEPEMQVLIESLFADEAENAAALYGSVEHVRNGLRIAQTLLSGNAMEQSKELLTYVVQLMALERKLAKHPDMLAHIARGMQHARTQVQHFPHTHESVLANLADMYGQTVSQLAPRIVVRGKPIYLKQKNNTERVRALLLTGIRAANLWRRHGGRWWHVLIARKRLAGVIADILAESRT